MNNIKTKSKLNWVLGNIFMQQDERIKEWSDKEEVMARICNSFDYMWRFYPNGKFVMEDRLLTAIRRSDCDILGKSSCGHLEYNSLDEMLLDWCDMLKTNKAHWEEELAIIENISKQKK